MSFPFSEQQERAGLVDDGAKRRQPSEKWRLAGLSSNAASVNQRKVVYEALEPRFLLSADLSILDNGGLNEYFDDVQNQLDSAVFSAPIPLIGTQLAEKPAGRIADKISIALNNFSVVPANGGAATADDVTDALRDSLGGLIKNNTILDTMTMDESEYRFFLTLAGSENELFDLDLALGTNPIIDPQLGVEDKVSISFDWEFDLTFGVFENADMDSFFFVDTSMQDELTIDNINAELIGELDAKGTAGVFSALIQEDTGHPEVPANGADPAIPAIAARSSQFEGSFDVDIVGTGSKTLRNDIADLTVNADVTGDANIYLDLDAAMVPEFADISTSDRIFNLAVEADVHISQSFSNSDTQATNFGNDLEVDYEDVRLDLGTFFGGFVDPTVAVLQDFLSPIKPIVDFLTFPIPVLSDIGEVVGLGKVTPLDLGLIAVAIDTDLTKEEKEKAINNITNTKAVAEFLNVFFDLGPIAEGLPDTSGLIGFKVQLTDAGKEDTADTDGDESKEKKAEVTESKKNNDAEEEVKNKTVKTSDFFATVGTNLEFPFLHDPEVAQKMLLGDTTPTLTSFGIEFEFGYFYKVTIPIIAPFLNAELRFDIGAKLDIDAGYDLFGANAFTQSLDFTSETALEDSIDANIHRLSDGFFFDDHIGENAPDNLQDGDFDPTNADKTDNPELTLTAKLSAAGKVGPDLLVAEFTAGVRVFFSTSVFFDLNDLPEAQLPEHADYVNDLRNGNLTTVPTAPYTYDGRVRIGELALIVNADAAGIFNYSGALYAGLEAFVFASVGVSPFEIVFVDETITIASALIYDFNIYQLEDSRVLAGHVLNAPILGAVDGNGTLSLFMGDTANQRVNTGPNRVGQDSETNEGFSVTTRGLTDELNPNAGETLVVKFYVLENDVQVERAQQVFTGVKRIVAAGGSGNDTVDIGANVMADADLSGGNNNDVLSYAGLGVAMLKGDDGDDVLIGGENGDFLEGGDGDDRLSGRGGDDTLRGQGNDDRLDGGLGVDNNIGGFGSDTYVWSPGEGEDVIFEAPNAAGDIDRATIGGSFGLTDGSYEAGIVGALEAGDLITLSQFNDAGQQKVLVETAVGTTLGESLVLDNIENIAISAGGGSDTIMFGDLTGTDVSLLAVDLSAADETNTAGDIDRVIYTGTDTADTLTVSSVVGNFEQTDFTTDPEGVVTSDIGRAVVKLSDTSPGRNSTAFIINSSPDKDVLEVRGLGGSDTLIVAANQDTTTGENLDASDLIQVELKGGSEDDTLIAAYDNVTIDGGAGTDSVEIVSDDKAITGVSNLELFATDLLISRTETGVGAVSDRLSFANVEDFKLNLDPTNAGNELRVFNTIDGNVNITGGSFDDSIFIETIAGTTTVDLNDGENTVTVGKDGSLAGIAHDLEFLGGSSGDHVIFDTSAEVDNEIATIGVGALLGLVAPGALRYNDAIEKVELRLGIGADSVIIPDLTRRIVVDGGGGIDEVEGTLFGMPSGALNGPGIETTTTESVILNNDNNDADTNWLVTFNSVSEKTELRSGVAGSFDPLLPGNAYSQLVLQSDNIAEWSVNLGEQGLVPNAGDTVNVEAMTLPIEINLRDGTDTLTVGPVLANIAAPLLVNGDGSDTLNVDDTAASAGGELTRVELGKVSAERSGNTVEISHTGIATLNVDMSDFRDIVDYIDSDVATTNINTNGGIDEVQVLGGSSAPNINTGAGNDIIHVSAATTSIDIDGGADDDTITFDVSGEAAPLIGAELLGAGSQAELRNLGPINSVTFQAVENANIILGNNSDELKLNYSATGFDLRIEGRGGDDVITVEQIGGSARVVGESGFDTVVLDIPNSPEDPIHANLGDDLRVEVEKALVDNSTNNNAVDWRVADDLLRAKNQSSTDYVDLLFTDGAEEVRILAGTASDILDIEEQAKIVDATINADQVTLELGPVVLEARDTGSYLNFDEVIDFSGLDVSNNYSEDGTSSGFKLSSTGSIVRENNISASAAGSSFSDRFMLTPNGGAGFALYSLELRNDGAADRSIDFLARTLNGETFTWSGAPTVQAGGGFVTVTFPDTFSALAEVSWQTSDMAVDDIVAELLLANVAAATGPSAIARSTVPEGGTAGDVDLLEFNTDSLTIRAYDWQGSNKVLVNTFTTASPDFYGLDYNVVFGRDGNGNIDQDIIRWEFQGDLIIPNIGSHLTNPADFGIQALGTRGLSLFATNDLNISANVNASAANTTRGAGGAGGSESGEGGTRGSGYERGGNGGHGGDGQRGAESGGFEPGSGQGGSGGSGEQNGGTGGSTTLSGGGGGGGGGVEIAFAGETAGAGGGGGQGGNGSTGDEGIDGRSVTGGINGGVGGAGGEGGEESSTIGTGGERGGEIGDPGGNGSRGDDGRGGQNNGFGATISGGGAGGSGAGGAGGNRGGGGGGGNGGAAAVTVFSGEQGGGGGGHGGHGGIGGTGGAGGDGGAGGGAIELAARGSVNLSNGLRALGGNGAEGSGGVEGSTGSGGEEGGSRSNGPAASGGDGGRGGTGGDGGQGGDGAGGAGGTVKLSGTVLNATDASVNTDGGLDGSLTVGGLNDGENGRYILESNIDLIFSGSTVIGMQGAPGSVSNVQGTSQFIGPRDDNPYLVGTGETPYIDNLIGGSELFGLLANVNIDGLLPDVGPNSPDSDAIVAVMRLDIGPFANSLDYTGFDMLLFMNLTDVNLAAPTLGINSAVENGLMFDGVGARQTLSALNANSVWATLIPDNNFLNPGAATDFISASIGGLNGRLSLDSTESTVIRDNEVRYIRAPGDNVSLGNLTGIDALTSSPGGDLLYGINTEQGALVVINAEDLSQRQLLKDGFDGANRMEMPMDIAVSSDGSRIYVIGGNVGLSVFESLASGELALINSAGTFGVGLDSSDVIAVQPDNAPGDVIAIGGPGGLWKFQVDNNGVGQAATLQSGLSNSTADLAFSTDGGLLYAAQPDDNRLRVFDGNDLLAPAQNLTMSGANAVASINDQANSVEHVYVTSNDGGLKVFERALGTSAFTEIESFQENINGIRGLAGATDVAVSADGRFVYVTSGSGESIAAFQRDLDSGELRFAQLLRGRTGLEAPTEIAVTGGANPGVFVGSEIGGLVAFDPITATADVEIQRLVVGYENLERLTVTSGNTDDVFRQIDAATVGNLLVNTNAGFNKVDFLNLAGTTTILTGFGEDEVTVRSDTTNVNLTIRTGDGEDKVVVRELAAGNIADIFLGTSVHDDVIQIDGTNVAPSATIFVDAFAGFDTLLFNAGTSSTFPALPLIPNGTIEVIGLGTVTYRNIESVPDFFPPEARVNGPFFLTEGDDITLDGFAAAATNASIVSTRWDLNGDGIFSDSFALDPFVRWDDFIALGMNDDGEYDITLEVLDSAGNVASDTGSLTIFNRDPIISFSGPTEILVGEEYEVTFSAVDPGDDSVSLWEIDWNDGSALQTFASDATSARHVYQTTGQFTPIIRATDEDVLNLNDRYVAVAPQVTVAPPAATITTVDTLLPLTLNEGDGVTLSAEAEGNPTAFSWDLNNDGVFGDENTFGVANGSELTLTTNELTILGLDDGDFDNTAYPISVDVSYGAGGPGVGSAVGSADLTVVNVAPTAELTNTTQSPNAPINEGDSATISFVNQSDLSSTDETAGFKYSYDFDNDGNFEITDSVDASVAVPLGLLNDAGTRTVRGVISDKDGGQFEVFTGVRVLEVVPQLILGGANVSTEGEVYTLNLSAIDPGEDTINEWTVNWGDGTSETVNTATASLDHVFADNGDLTINVTAQDEDGLYSAQKQVTVSNVAPTLTISGPAVIDEGDGYTLTLGASDPGDDNINSWTINWGDGNTETVPGSSDQVFHIFADDSQGGTYEINVTAGDDDGEYLASTVVTVENVAPTTRVSATGTSEDILASASGIDSTVAVNEGSNFILYLEPPTDPGDDTVTEYTIDWGDGSPVQTEDAATAGANGIVPTLSLNHVYTDGEAIYDIIVSLTDEDGTFLNTVSLSADARNVAPIVEIAGDSAVNEGDLYSLTLSPFDPGDDTISSYIIDWGDEGPLETFSSTDPVTHIYRNVVGSVDYTISVDIVDEDETDPTFNADATKIVQVNEVAPVLSVSGADNAIEGTPYTLTLGELIDPGSELGVIPVSQYVVDWGDGAVNTYDTAGDVMHRFEDGLFNNQISVDVVAGTVTFLDAARLNVQVANSAPVINLSTVTVNEAPLPDLNRDGIVNIFDVSIVASSLGGDVNSSPLVASADLNGDGVVDNTDLDIVLDAYDQQVPLPTPPSEGSNVGSFSAGDTALLEGTFTDIGLADSHEAMIDWGDGSTSLAMVTPGSGGENQFAGRHTYAKAGVYKVTVTVADDEDADVVETLAYVSGAAIHDGVLHIVGTSGADTVNVEPNAIDATSIDVSANFLAGGMQSFSLIGLTGAVVFAGNGNDVVNVADSVALPFMIAGGRGEDELTAGGGAAVLIGGADDDELTGGSESNLLIGGGGLDTLTGGGQADLLVGGLEDDVLNGGGGNDTSYFNGAESEYNINAGGADTTVTSANGLLDGDDTLSNVEDILFEDSVDPLPNLVGNPWADELIARLSGPSKDLDADEAAWLLFE